MLITLLNELLSGEHHIEDLTFLDKEDHSENIHDKGIIYDLYCRNFHRRVHYRGDAEPLAQPFLGSHALLCVLCGGRQMENPSCKEVRVPDTEEETVSGMLMEEEVPYGVHYKLPAVYGIFLMNFKEDGLESKFRTDTVISDRDSGRVVNPNFRQIYLQFPYFTKSLEECETLSDKLMYALKNMNNWNRMPDALKEQVFSHLERLAAKANLSEGDRLAYEKAVDRYNVSRIVENDIWEKGLREGVEKGKIEVAENFIRLGVSSDIISKATGLTLNRLKANLD